MLGFALGWTIFQALFMGGRAKSTFTSELLSMNCLIGGMMLVGAIAFVGNAAAHDLAEPLFLSRMSLGAAFALPMNWWLVAHHLKHGMLAVRPKGEAATCPA